MTSPFSDELISAYLDGELTAQEQVYVEEQLREHADLRRMCDELRALRATLQAMPVAEPPENLAERILRQAERRMLSDEAAMVDSSFADAAQAPSPAGRPRYALRDWRVGVAVVAALAACVLAMLWLPQMSPQARDVAQAPNTAAPSSPVERRVEIVAAPVRDAAKSVVPGVDFAIQDGDSRSSRGTRCDARSSGVVPVRSTTCPVGSCPGRGPRVGLDQCSQRAGARGVPIPGRSDGRQAGTRAGGACPEHVRRGTPSCSRPE